jgi:hypothetical protein
VAGPFGLTCALEAPMGLGSVRRPLRKAIMLTRSTSVRRLAAAVLVLAALGLAAQPAAAQQAEGDLASVVLADVPSHRLVRSGRFKRAQLAPLAPKGWVDGVLGGNYGRSFRGQGQRRLEIIAFKMASVLDAQQFVSEAGDFTAHRGLKEDLELDMGWRVKIDAVPAMGGLTNVAGFISGRIAVLITVFDTPRFPAVDELVWIANAQSGVIPWWAADPSIEMPIVDDESTTDVGRLVAVLLCLGVFLAALCVAAVSALTRNRSNPPIAAPRPVSAGWPPPPPGWPPPGS